VLKNFFLTVTSLIVPPRLSLESTIKNCDRFKGKNTTLKIKKKMLTFKS
jgi:hypothetical protein